MIARRTRFCGAVGVLAVVGILSNATPALSTTDSLTIRSFDGSLVAQGPSRADPGLQSMMHDVVAAGVPGGIVRVQDARETRLATSGVADLATGTPLRHQARFRAGSVTKTFVAAVILQLVEEGQLALDAPVATWMPALLAGGDTITVRQLLNHTSGLFDYTDDPAVLAGIVENRVFEPRELVAIAETHNSTAAPGTVWAYSNTNYIVAGLLVEAVTHHRLGRELRQRIFGPLRLWNTSFPVATTQIPGYHARGYVPADFVPTSDGRPFDVTALNPSAAWAAGAIVSNATDLSRFYRALMTGEILGPDMLHEMTTTVAQDPTNPQQFRYGLGVERVQDVCGANWGHAGAIFGYQDMAYWNEQTGRTVVVATTMFPAPAAATEPLTALTESALCGTS